jgi:uncharacterized protein (DUF1684 family)
MASGIKSLALITLALLVGSSSAAATGSREAERVAVDEWRAQRLAALTSDTGWLTLAGLFWLRPGENTFGRAPSNTLVLENAALAESAGTFIVTGHDVRFVASVGARITHAGQSVTAIELVSDAKEDPTVLESGPVQFFLIERAGNLGVRVRDLENPRRRDFRGLEYYPVDPDWSVTARFEAYQPHRHIPIVNILGMEQEMDCPGAVIFRKNGQEWRLDAVLEEPQDQELFIMFADSTSGHETYGGGRFLYVPLPHDGKTVLDFNRAYNPPCAFNDFATCPLPPHRNRLKLGVEAGEKTYASGHLERPESLDH